MWEAIIIIALLVGGITAHKVMKTDDSFPEQVIESILKQETGVEMDFSAEDKAHPPTKVD